MLIGAEYQAIFKVYERGEFERAIKMVTTCLRRHRDDGRGWELLGLIQYARGRYSIAVSALERASLFVPLRPAARVCLGHAYGRVGRRNLSRDLLNELIDDTSMPIPLLLQVATGLDAIDQPGLAMKACRKASEREPHHAQPYYDLGYYASRCGHPAHLTESLARKAISLDPQNVCYRVGLASLLMRMDRDEEAYALVQKLSNDQIESVNCCCCLERIVDLFEAAHDYRRVILCRQQLLSLEVRGIESDCD